MTRQVIVIVGTGGMGEAIARRQAAGHHLILADFDQEALDRRVDALAAEGFTATGHHVDVSSADSLGALADDAAASGPVMHVVHTAGLSPVQAPTEAILQVDLLGVALSLDAFGAVIADGGAGVVISSMAGHLFPPVTAEQAGALAHTPSADLLGLDFLQPEAIGDPGTAYGIAKQANQIRVRAASVAWGRRGARVNAISPGVIGTSMGNAELSGPSGEIMRSFIEMSGTGRIGTAADIADAAAFLLSPAASFITGTDLLVDGGVVAAVTTGAP
ncbi:SDR family oxidoreductase [Gordonia sp. NPDC003425]